MVELMELMAMVELMEIMVVKVLVRVTRHIEVWGRQN